MSSKLFRAVVGFGITFGAASAACSVSMQEPRTQDAGVPVTNGEDDTSPRRTDDYVASNADASDSSVIETRDGASDAADAATTDATVNAFCDATWPTTKGSRGPDPCIDPLNECADAGPPRPCFPETDAGTCNFFEAVATSCVKGEWRCPANAHLTEDCPR